MAGFSKIYCIGGAGGFGGSDGVKPILVQIWLGEGNRQWFEARYFDDRFKPMGSVKMVVPPVPDMPDNLLDACMVFFPEPFNKCPSYPEIEKKLKKIKFMDFNLNEGVPKGWDKFREEGRAYFNEFSLYEAVLNPVNREEKQ